jgi:hypothetical protein
MQIDFHHGTTYCVARLAGFSHSEASIVAYCAQYVDDATNEGLIHFKDGISLFLRISSAHKMLDYRNFEELANYRVWIPYHFLPGNGGLPAGQDPDSPDPKNTLVNKIICRPNSHVAQDMVRECIHRRHQPYALQRLGVVMHVYADTWAHQGFAGINHPINKATRLVDEQGRPDEKQQQHIEEFFEKGFVEQMVQTVSNRAMSKMMPLGHGAVLSYPDRPFLKWGYTNGLGIKIERDNPTDFLEAAEWMYRWMYRYRAGNPDAKVPELSPQDKTHIDRMFRTITDTDKKKRHQKWLESIRSGEFSFGPAEPIYIPKGKGSWKYEALGTDREIDTENEIYSYQAKFLDSNWKLFHDALNAHRFFVIHELLPKYGLCEA